MRVKISRKDREVEITEPGEYSIGRVDDCPYIGRGNWRIASRAGNRIAFLPQALKSIENPQISLTLTDASLTLTDLGSRYGNHLDGEFVMCKEVEPGTHDLRLGRAHFELTYER